MADEPDDGLTKAQRAAQRRRQRILERGSERLAMVTGERAPTATKGPEPTNSSASGTHAESARELPSIGADFASGGGPGLDEDGEPIGMEGSAAELANLSATLAADADRGSRSRDVPALDAGASSAAASAPPSLAAAQSAKRAGSAALASKPFDPELLRKASKAEAERRARSPGSGRWLRRLRPSLRTLVTLEAVFGFVAVVIAGVWLGLSLLPEAQLAVEVVAESAARAARSPYNELAHEDKGASRSNAAEGTGEAKSDWDPVAVWLIDSLSSVLDSAMLPLANALGGVALWLGFQALPLLLLGVATRLEMLLLFGTLRFLTGHPLVPPADLGGSAKRKGGFDLMAVVVGALPSLGRALGVAQVVKAALADSALLFLAAIATMLVGLHAAKLLEMAAHLSALVGFDVNAGAIMSLIERAGSANIFVEVTTSPEALSALEGEL